MDPGKGADDGGARLRVALAAALRAAMRARDVVAASALRTTLSAIANAEAVPAGSAGSAGSRATATVGSPHFAGAVAGLGAGDVARRQLTAADVLAIVRAEISERERLASDYAASGLSSQAERFRTEARILTSVITTADLNS